jgi:hypothetical protein
MRILNVARFWEIDPDIVCNWSIVDFFDREEYMTIQLDMNQMEDSDNDNREDWQGPGNG